MAYLVPMPSGGDLISLMIFNNSITLGLFGNLIIAAIFCITFITLMGQSPKRAFLAASIISFLSSLPLAAMTVIGPAVPVLLLALTGISFIPIMFEGR